MYLTRAWLLTQFQNVKHTRTSCIELRVFAFSVFNDNIFPRGACRTLFLGSALVINLLYFGVRAYFCRVFIIMTRYCKVKLFCEFKKSKVSRTRGYSRSPRVAYSLTHVNLIFTVGRRNTQASFVTHSGHQSVLPKTIDLPYKRSPKDVVPGSRVNLLLSIPSKSLSSFCMRMAKVGHSKEIR